MNNCRAGILLHHQNISQLAKLNQVDFPGRNLMQKKPSRL